MSNKCLDAAWTLKMSPMRKLLLIALADQADDQGRTRVSRSRLARMTNQSRATVNRELKALAGFGFLEVVEVATAKTVQGYGLRLRGLTVSPGLTVNRAQGDLGGGSHRAVSDPSYVPLVNTKAEPPKRRLEMPTVDQVTKLAHVLLGDPHTQLTDDGDLEEFLKRACAQAGFCYDADIIRHGINRAVAARGGKPWLPLKGQALRR